MPAAAVIPAPLAYTKVVAVKTLLVGYQPRRHGPAVLRPRAKAGLPVASPAFSGVPVCPFTWVGQACSDLLL